MMKRHLLLCVLLAGVVRCAFADTEPARSRGTTDAERGVAAPDAFAGTNVIKWEELFSGTTVPAGWRTIDNDGSGNMWSFRQMVPFTSGDTVRPQAGASFWFSSFNNANTSGRIDEYIITPRLPSIDVGDSLHFYAGAIGGQYHDSLRVFVSTTDSALASFTTLIAYFRVLGPAGSWHRYSFDMSAFAGSQVFVAVNYFIVDGGPTGTHSDNIWVDHFILEGLGTGVEDHAEAPYGFALAQNYPNPFNPSTTIEFRIPNSEFVTLGVFDILGQEVATLVNEAKEPGSYSVPFDGSSLPSGVYTCRLTAGGRQESRRMLLVK